MAAVTAAGVTAEVMEVAALAAVARAAAARAAVARAVVVSVVASEAPRETVDPAASVVQEAAVEAPGGAMVAAEGGCSPIGGKCRLPPRSR